MLKSGFVILVVVFTSLQFGVLLRNICLPRIRTARTVVTCLGSFSHEPTIKFEIFAVEKKNNADEHALKANKNFRKIQKGFRFSPGDVVQENKQPGKPHERGQLDANQYIFLISTSLNVVGENLRVGLTVPAQ